MKQDRLKASRSGLDGGAAGEEAGETAAVPSGQVRFRLEDFYKLLEPIVSNAGNSKEIAEYVMRLAEEDPWDASHERHEAALEKLMGRRRVPKAKQDESDSSSEEDQPRPKARAKGKGKARGKGNAKRTAKANTTSQSSPTKPRLKLKPKG